MNRPFLDITDEKLELSSLRSPCGTWDLPDILFDINSNYDGAVADFVAVSECYGLTSFNTSFSIDNSDEYGIDQMVLDSFFDSVNNYEVH